MPRYRGQTIFEFDPARGQGRYGASERAASGSCSSRGTQERGNKLWRGTFLRLGDVRLYVLNVQRFAVRTGTNVTETSPSVLLRSANGRLVLEQLLVMEAVAAAADSKVWVVNARQ